MIDRCPHLTAEVCSVCQELAAALAELAVLRAEVVELKRPQLAFAGRLTRRK